MLCIITPYLKDINKLSKVKPVTVRIWGHPERTSADMELRNYPKP